MGWKQRLRRSIADEDDVEEMTKIINDVFEENNLQNDYEAKGKVVNAVITVGSGYD